MQEVSLETWLLSRREYKEEQVYVYIYRKENVKHKEIRNNDSFCNDLGRLNPTNKWLAFICSDMEGTQSSHLELTVQNNA